MIVLSSKQDKRDDERHSQPKTRGTNARVCVMVREALARGVMADVAPYRSSFGGQKPLV